MHIVGIVLFVGYLIYRFCSHQREDQAELARQRAAIRAYLERGQ